VRVDREEGWRLLNHAITSWMDGNETASITVLSSFSSIAVYAEMACVIFYTDMHHMWILVYK